MTSLSTVRADTRTNRILTQVLGEAGIGVALVALAAFFLAAAPHFATTGNIRDIMTQITLNTILAVGMTFVILVGGIDLSVGSVIALCAVVAGKAMENSGAGSIPAGIALSLVIGALCGLISGFVTERWRVPSFIVTLGMLYFARGAAEQYTDARTIYSLPKELTAFGTRTIAGIPAVFAVALLIVAAAWFILSRTVFGRLVYATGNNEEAVRLSGHRTNLIKIVCFVIGGLCVGIAAVIYMARLGVASPILGQGYELNAIAAVVIGGASLSGGRGSVIGTLLGACLLGVLTNGLLLMGVSDFQRIMVTGAVIIIAVILDAYRKRLMTHLSGAA
ncbi:ABC transporter permease [Nocardia sp. NPDC052001]|uniref:ABC transporter permease n=1 Tax=unclassified Nocardia TaxID=2637762 RepID=UPI0034422ED9